MGTTGMGMHAAASPGQRTRRRAEASVALLLAELFLPLLLIAAPAGLAFASVITTTDDGRTGFDVALSGLPYHFNIYVPDKALVTSFRLSVSTAANATPPVVPANLSLDLGLDGVDWFFGGGPEGAFGLQSALSDGASSRRVTVGQAPATLSFLLPRGANVSSLSFELVPAINMSLWNASEYVTMLSGTNAVPLNLTANSALEIADLNGDGVLHLVATGADGNLHSYARVGTSGLLFNETIGAFQSGLRKGRILMDPAPGDLDRDGDLDLVTGSLSAGLAYFERANATTGPPFEFFENTTMFAGIPLYSNASPTLGDLDGDGDLDLVIGAADGTFVHYRNQIAEGTGVNWSVQNTFLRAELAVSGSASPKLVDLDGEGDLDLVSGDTSGSIFYFENTGSASSPSFQARGAFPNVGAVGRSTPALTDWDGDGRPDVFFGSKSGLVLFARSLGGLPADVTVALSGSGETFSASSGQTPAPVAVSLPAPMLAALPGATLPLAADSWGNELETVTLTIGSTHFGDLTLGTLSVVYAATLRTSELASDYRALAATAAPVGSNILVPFELNGAPLVPATSPFISVGSIAVRIDDAPAFLSLPALTLDEDTANASLVDLRDYLVDEDVANTTFTLVSATNSTYVPLSVSGGHFLSADAASGDLNNNWTGTVEFVARARDPFGQTVDSPPFRLTVLNVPDAPVIEYIPAKYLGATEELALVVKAIDGDPLDIIRYILLDPSPPGIILDPVSGLLRWSPSSAERVGVVHIVVAATDGALADTQAFDVYFLPSAQPVFGRSLPDVKVLAGRPEFLNLFDFATGNVSLVRSLTIAGPAHPFANLSADRPWIALDYPADFPASADRLTISADTDQGLETVTLDVSVAPVPTSAYIAPFPSTPLSRGLTHRVELLRYLARFTDFRNLSFSVDHPLAAVSGFNLSFYLPPDYPGLTIALPITARAGAEVASTVWAINIESRSVVPRIGRLALISAGARDVDLGYALEPLGVDASSWPLSTTSPHLALAGFNTFRISFPRWPLDVPARDFWPIDRARILDASGQDVLEVEIGFDGRSRFVDRVQYFTEDETAVIDGSFAFDPELAGSAIQNLSVTGTGSFVPGPLEPIVRYDGTSGAGWQVAFTKDTALEQITIVAVSLAAEGQPGDSRTWGVWAIVTPRDDPPTLSSPLSDLEIEPGKILTTDLSSYFTDEEGDDLLFTLSTSVQGVSLDRATGWLRVDGRENINLTGVVVVASESRNQSLFAVSNPIAIRLSAPPGATPAPRPESTPGFWESWNLEILVIAVLAAAGTVAFAMLWRREEREEEEADDALGGIAASLPGSEDWALVGVPPLPSVPPPAPDDPEMLALEEEWARVIASRQADSSSSPSDTESPFDENGARRRAAHPPLEKRPPAEPPRQPSLSSSDTETERRAGEIESDVDVVRRRRRNR